MKRHDITCGSRIAASVAAPGTSEAAMILRRFELMTFNAVV